MREREREISKLNALIAEEKQNSKILEDDFLSRKSQLESYISSERQRITELEDEKDTLRRELAQVEASLADTQCIVTKNASKLAESADEIRSLKLELDASNKEFLQEIEALRVEKEKSNRSITHLKELLDQAEADVDHYRKNAENVQK